MASALVKKMDSMSREMVALKKENAALKSGALSLSAITAALRVASKEEMADFISVMNRALGDPEIRVLVDGELPAPDAPVKKSKKTSAKSSAAAVDAAAAGAPSASSSKSKKEASEAVMSAVSSWNVFVKETEAILLGEGKRRVKKKTEELADGEFNYETLLEAAGRRNAELKGETWVPKKKKAGASPSSAAAPAPAPAAAPKPPAAAAAPVKKPRNSPPMPPPDSDDEDSDEDSDEEDGAASYTSAAGGGPASDDEEDGEGEEEMVPFEYEGVDYWLSGEGIVYEKLEFGGLGERVGILDKETMMLVRD